MYFHKEKKIAFVFPPKCGTHTTNNFFERLKWHRLPQVHENLEFFANKYPNLNQYKVYGFFRNPLLRFESGVRYARRTIPLDCDSYDTVIDQFAELEGRLLAFVRPQVHWLADPRVTPLDFDNLESELHRVTGESMPIVHLNAAGDSWRSVITDKVRAFVREYYAADYALAKDRLGKTYEG